MTEVNLCDMITTQVELDKRPTRIAPLPSLCLPKLQHCLQVPIRRAIVFVVRSFTHCTCFCTAARIGSRPSLDVARSDESLAIGIGAVRFIPRRLLFFNVLKVFQFLVVQVFENHTVGYGHAAASGREVYKFSLYDGTRDDSLETPSAMPMLAANFREVCQTEIVPAGTALQLPRILSQSFSLSLGMGNRRTCFALFALVDGIVVAEKGVEPAHGFIFKELVANDFGVRGRGFEIWFIVAHAQRSLVVFSFLDFHSGNCNDCLCVCVHCTCHAMR